MDVIVACENYEVGLIGLKRSLNKSHHSGCIESGILTIGKLNDFELAVLIELKLDVAGLSYINFCYCRKSGYQKYQ